MNKYMTVDALLVLARDKYDDSESELRAAIEQYGKEQYARGVNDVWPANRGSVTMTEWTTTEWPDWKDNGRRVEVELEDGQIVRGELFVDDFFLDGEGDEVPIFKVLSDDDVTYGFAANNRWRFLQGSDLVADPTTAAIRRTTQQPLTDEQIDRHTLLAQECPPGSKVILVSSLRRLRAHNIRSAG